MLEQKQKQEIVSNEIILKNENKKVVHKFEPQNRETKLVDITQEDRTEIVYSEEFTNINTLERPAGYEFRTTEERE